jgi:hypothetical protein
MLWESSPDSRRTEKTLIAAFVAFMESDATLTGPINLSNPTEFTMIELANLIIQPTNSKLELTFLRLPEDGLKQRQPDIAIATEYLNCTKVCCTLSPISRGCFRVTHPAFAAKTPCRRRMTCSQFILSPMTALTSDTAEAVLLPSNDCSSYSFAI